MFLVILVMNKIYRYKRNSNNTRFNKNSSNYKKYVKIAKNQIQNLQIKNKEVYRILLESQLKGKTHSLH